MQPDTRNPVIASELEVLKITENRYSGIPTIRRYGEEKNISKPVEIENRELILFCKTPRTRKEICDYLGLSSVTYAIQTHVMPLVDKGIIKMSMPDKPKSPKQLFYTDMFE